jgi:hypothetical protein
MNQIFYGCYQSNYKKHYKWQCRQFTDEASATNYTMASDKSKDGKTILIPINNNIPKILHKLILRQEIIKNEYIEINE